MATQMRWLAVLPAAIAGWYLALIIALLLHSGVESLCPADQIDSGMCVAPWFPYASHAISAFGAGLAAVLIITFAVLAAPAHRVLVSRATLVGGLIVSSYMLLETSALVEFASAVTFGVLTVIAAQRYLKRSKSPNPAPESGLPSAAAQRER
jgi:hypothetical protein